MKNYYLIVFLTILISACSDDFLDKHSNTEITASSLYSSKEDVQLVVNGVYKQLQSNSIYGGSFNTLGVCSHVEYDSFTDNSWNWYVLVGPGAYTKGEIDNSNAFFYKTWAAYYQGIARCNEAIYNIEAMTEDLISNENQEMYLGQLYALRAIFYFNLAVYYEDVPLLIEPQILEDAYSFKNSQREVLDQVISDLTNASKVLPVSYSSNLYGYITQGAALGLLARVYLFDKEWEKAAEAAKSVIDLGIYNLSLSYDEQFTPNGEFSGDVVFSVRFADLPGYGVGELFSKTQYNIIDPTHLPLKNLVNDYYCTDGLSIDESPLYDASNPKLNRDSRLTATIYFNGDIFNKDLPTTGVNTVTGYGIKKYIRDSKTENGTAITAEGGQDYYMLRYADILLMRAEALIELNTINAEVYSLIDQVRDRVGMPHVEDVEGTNLSQSILRDILRHERRVEFALEGLRFFDIKRWGIVEEAYNKATLDASEIPTMPSFVYRDGKSETFPIPLTELDANPNLVQNEAWK